MSLYTHNLGALEPAMTPNQDLAARAPISVARRDHRLGLESFARRPEAQRRTVNFGIVDHTKRRQPVGHLCRDSGAELGPAGLARYTPSGSASESVCERDLGARLRRRLLGSK
jgi:hypothetical protein